MTNMNENNNMDSIPVKRLVSKRDIGIQAFELENGNLMLEATFLDPYHLIRLIIHIAPQTKTIVYAKCDFANHPHSGCPIVSSKAKLIIGLKIERGIGGEISKRLGGIEGCVHLREIALETINFGAAALIGFDEGFGLMNRDFNLLEESKRLEISKPFLKNTCYIYKDNQ